MQIYRKGLNYGPWSVNLKDLTVYCNNSFFTVRNCPFFNRISFFQSMLSLRNSSWIAMNTAVLCVQNTDHMFVCIILFSQLAEFFLFDWNQRVPCRSHVTTLLLKPIISDTETHILKFIRKNPIGSLDIDEWTLPEMWSHHLKMP